MGSMGGKVKLFFCEKRNSIDLNFQLLAEALIACHKNSIASGGKRFALKQFIAGRNRLEIEGSQALAEAFEVILDSFF
jgi:hypothetical protein